MDHPLSAPSDALQPWRATALVAAAIAGIELVVLVFIGVALLGRSMARAEHAAPAAAAPHHVAPRPAPKPAPVGKPKLTRAQTAVIVLNGNGISGAAGIAASSVRARGYRVAAVGNAPHQGAAASMVMYRPGYRAEALRLGRDLDVAVVAPLDGLRLSDLGGARLAYVVGSG